MGHFFFGDADAVVFDFDMQAAIAVGGAQLDLAAFDFGGQAVLETIFDDGLQEHAGNKGFESVFVEFLDDFEIIATEAGDFDVEIIVDEFEFFVERNEGFVLAQQATQNIAEFEDDAAGGVGIEAD